MKTHLFAPVTSTLCRLLAVAVVVLIHFGSSSAHAQRMPQDTWYLAKEISSGFDGGRFSHPHDLAIGPDSNIYICDRYNNRIQVFSQDGTFLRKWGVGGSAQGQLNEPSGIFITQDGKVYVSEASNHRLQVFDSEGKSLLTMGQFGSGNGQLNYPYGVAIDNAGNVYTADMGNNRVMVFSADGSYLRQWGGPGDTNGLFRSPIGITRTPDNKIAVCERDGYRRTQVFSTNGTYQFQFATSGAPHALKTDANGNFYVVSRDWNGVWVYDPSGNEIRHFGQNGGGSDDGRFNPHGLVVSNGKVFIGDWDNNRISVFTTNGVFVKNFGSYGTPDFGRMSGVTKDAKGNIYVSDSDYCQIRKFDKNLIFIATFGRSGAGNGEFNAPANLAISPDQKLFVADEGNNRVQVLDLNGGYITSFGAPGSSNGKFNHPVGVAVSSDNKVYVSDRENNRIQVFDMNGNFLFKFGTLGSLDNQFNKPCGLSITPEGYIAVADSNNSYPNNSFYPNAYIKIFDKNGKFIKKIAWESWVYPPYWGPSPHVYNICFASDGVIYASGSDTGNAGGSAYRAYFPDGGIIVVNPTYGWSRSLGGGPTSWNFPLTETIEGDLLVAGGDKLLHLWKRTYRLAIPEPGNTLPLPVIVAQKRRPGTTLVDIDYKVSDSDSPRVTTALLAFKNGGNTLSDVIPMKTFVEGTATNIGTNITTGEVHRVTWDASKDWSTNFANIQFQIIAKDNRDLLNLDFIEIPGVTNATTTNPPLKISKSPLSDNDFLYAMYWCVAIGDPSLKFDRAVDGNISLTLDSNNSPEMTNTINGLWVTRYSSPNWSGNSLANIETTINFARGSDWGDLNNAGASSTYVGMINPPVDGLYNFSISADDGVNWNLAGQQNGGSSQPISLKAGTPVPITINYSDSGGGWRSMTVQWLMPGKTNWSPVPDSVYTTYVSPKIAFGSALIQGGGLNAAGREFLLAKMGLRQATPAEITRAKEAGTPGVVNKWTPKFQVGPGERPAAVNAYGFDTGGNGTWVVPITVTNNATN